MYGNVLLSQCVLSVKALLVLSIRFVMLGSKGETLPSVFPKDSFHLDTTSDCVKRGQAIYGWLGRPSASAVERLRLGLTT